MASQPVSLLVLSSAARADRLQPLLSGLGARLAVETSTDPAQLRQLEPTTVLYVDSCDRELDEGEAAALLRFVQRGGGAVVAGDTLHTWRESAPVTDLAGFVPDGRTVHAELLLRDAAEATLLGDRLPVHGTVHLLPHAPPGATSLVETTWQHENQVVAYSRPYGAGRFTFLGLQHDGDAYHD
ncbi:MAG TPA: DUF4350 domain-containing protein, partial [Candidatus Dormibacteraeota bacterium]|nr:DUF4350 domain-containing protein [Candidatus Dormibacteraeota bacterium]